MWCQEARHHLPSVPSGTKPFFRVRSLINVLTSVVAFVKEKGRKILDRAINWVRYHVARGEYPYYFEVIRLHTVREGEEPFIARPSGHSYPQQHRQQNAQQVTHQIHRQAQSTREEPPNPPNLNRAIAPAPPPVPDPLAVDLETNPIGRNEPVDLTQEDSDGEDELHNPEATTEPTSKASAGPIYEDGPARACHPPLSQKEPREKIQSQADATPPNENTMLHGAATGAPTQIKRRPITSFKDRVVALKAFKEAHGHTNVKARDDPGLARFCDNLRWARKNPGRGLAVTNGRIAALDELGFDWKGAEKQNKQADPNSEHQKEEDSGKSHATPDDSLTAGSSLSNDKTSEPEGEAPVNSGRIKLGTKVSKMFVDNGRRRPFLGSVTGYDPETRLYRIVYEDRDTEDLFEDEVRVIILKRGKLRVKRNARGTILASGTKRRVNKLASPTQGIVIVLGGTLTYCDQGKEPCYLLSGKWKCGKGGKYLLLSPAEDPNFLFDDLYSGNSPAEVPTETQSFAGRNREGHPN